MPTRVALVTLGCARNEVDSEELAGRLELDKSAQRVPRELPQPAALGAGQYARVSHRPPGPGPGKTEGPVGSFLPLEHVSPRTAG